MNQVITFSLTMTRKNGYATPFAAVTPVTEAGKVQLTAIAPAGVLLLHPLAEVVAT
jgi:hypothetical protein